MVRADDNGTSLMKMRTSITWATVNNCRVNLLHGRSLMTMNLKLV